MNEFGRWVVDRRKSLKLWTQTALAVKADISTKTISTLESSGGLFGLRDKTREKLARALEIDIEEMERAAKSLGELPSQRPAVEPEATDEPLSKAIAAAMDEIHHASPAAAKSLDQLEHDQQLAALARAWLTLHDDARKMIVDNVTGANGVAGKIEPKPARAVASRKDFKPTTPRKTRDRGSDPNKSGW